MGIFGTCSDPRCTSSVALAQQRNRACHHLVQRRLAPSQQRRAAVEVHPEPEQPVARQVERAAVRDGVVEKITERTAIFLLNYSSKVRRLPTPPPPPPPPLLPPLRLKPRLPTPARPPVSSDPLGGADQL